MLGVFEISRTAPIGLVIEDIVLLDECSFGGGMGRTDKLFALKVTKNSCLLFIAPCCPTFDFCPLAVVRVLIFYRVLCEDGGCSIMERSLPYGCRMPDSLDICTAWWQSMQLNWRDMMRA